MAKATCEDCGKAISECKEHYTILNLRYVPNAKANAIRSAAALAGTSMVAFMVDTVMERIEAAKAA